MCNELSEGRIAIIAVGESRVFSHLHTIASSLRIPFIFIKWNTLEEEDLLVDKINKLNEDDDADIDSSVAEVNQINIHPSAHALTKSIIDLIDYYKWEYVTIMYQETTGLAHIEDLIKLPRRSSNVNKLRIQVRQLSADVNKWIYLMKDVKLSGSSHIIVDVQTKYLNKFLQQVIQTISNWSYLRIEN